MPACPPPPALSLLPEFSTHPIRSIIVTAIVIILLLVGALAIRADVLRASRTARWIPRLLGSISVVALAIALYTDIGPRAQLVDDSQRWLLPSFTSSASGCLASVDMRLRHIHALEVTLMTIEVAAGGLFVICFLGILIANRDRLRERGR